MDDTNPPTHTGDQPGDDHVELTIDVPRIRWLLMLAMSAAGLGAGLPGRLAGSWDSIVAIVGTVAGIVLVADWYARRRHKRAGIDAVIAAFLSGGVGAYLWVSLVVDRRADAVPFHPRVLILGLLLAGLSALVGWVTLPARGQRRWGIAGVVSASVLTAMVLVDYDGAVENPVVQVVWLAAVAGLIGSIARIVLDPSVKTRGRQQGNVGLGTLVLSSAGVFAGPLTALEQTITRGEVSVELVIVGATVFPVLAIIYLIRQAHERAIAEMAAHHDPLTGLLTRSLFMDRLSVAITRARRRGGRLALLFIDVDELKEINDTFGHDAGDLVLARIASRITEHLRDEDSVARIGGDEFVVLLPEVPSLAAVDAVGNKLLDSIRDQVQLGGADLSPSVSIGTAIFPDHARSSSALLEKADASMYQAKRLGRGRVQAYSEDLAVRARLRAWMEQELRISLETGALSMSFQPIVDVTDEIVVGFEAQPRWDHPELGTIPSELLTPLVEEAGLATDFVDQMLGRACTRVARWRDQGLAEVPIAFKVSRRQVTSSQILGPVLRALMRSQLPPRMLELELTEATLTANREMTKRVMTELRNHGVRCIAEDFGLGNAGLGYLTRLPLAGIKVDRSLVAEIGQHGTAPVIEAITAVASVMAIRVGAEGIMTPEQFRYLRGGGLTLMQGDLLCPSIDEEELESRLLAASLNRGTSMAPLMLREVIGPTTHEPLDRRVADLLVSMAGHAQLDPHAVDHVVGRLPQGTLE